MDVCVIARNGCLSIRVHLLEIGGLQALFVPGEWFSKLGREITDRFGLPRVWITTVADFDLLYLPDRESRSSKDWYGVAPEMRTISDHGIDLLLEGTQRLLAESAASGETDGDSR